MAWEIYTLGGGEYLYPIFQGVAALTQGNSYMQIIKFTALIAAIWVLIESSLKNQFMPNIKWFIGFILIYNVLMVPKTDVIIVDELNRVKPRQNVSNVPLALGAFASLTSRAGHELTKTFEVAFLTNNDISYHNHGLLFGSRLIEQTSSLKIIDSEFAQSMNNFIKQCVFYDILLHRYTLDELKQSKDIWAFITANPAKSRSFLYRYNKNSEILTCRAGAQKLTTLWEKQLDKTATLFGIKVFPNEAPENAKKLILSKLTTSYSSLIGISKDAGDIIKQNMLINAMKSSSRDFASHYLHTRADIQTKTAYQASKAQGSHWVPILRIMLEVLFYGAFPLVFMLMLLPIGGMVVVSYFGLFIWLQSWGPLYAILNMIMETDTKARSIAAAALADGSHDLTLVTQAGITAVNQDVSLAAGSWASMIPFISLILLYGAKSVTQLATATMAAPQAAANAAASEVATGNISLANSNFGNSSYDNVNANKWSDSAFHDGGRVQMMNSLGGVTSYTQAGKENRDQTATVSRLPNLQIMKNDTESLNLSRTANQHYQFAQNWRALADESRSSGLRQIGEVLDTHNISKSNNISYGNDVSADERKTYQTAIQEIQDAARQQGISTQKLLSLSASGTLNFSGNKGLNRSSESNDQEGSSTPNSLIKNIGGDVRVGLDGKINTTSDDQHSTHEKVNKSNDLNKAINVVTNAVKSGRIELHDTHGNTLNESITQDFNTAKRFEENKRVSYEMARQYNEQAQYAKTSSISANYDMTDEAINNLAKHRGNDGKPIGLDKATELLSNPNTRENALKVAQGGGPNYQAGFNEHKNRMGVNNLPNVYNTEAQKLDKETKTEYNSQSVKEGFAKATKNKGIEHGNLKEEVDKIIEDKNNKIDNTQMDKAGVVEEVNEELNKGTLKRLVESANNTLNPWATEKKPKSNFNEDNKNDGK